MPSTLPEGDPVPASGELPESALHAVGDRALSIYVHVPFCATRCGYCDFNTYTADELSGTSIAAYLSAARAEIRLAREVLGERAPAVSTVFFGGGTPSLLPPVDLEGVLSEIRECFGLSSDVEITVEANPESTNDAALAAWLAAGVTRLSLGMQSAVPHVLATLDRVHTSGRPIEVARRAHELGFRDVSIDLIYGTPGETWTDWRASLDAALDAEPEHVSAYSLIVEPGTRLARRVRAGELASPDDDDLAERYLLAEQVLGDAGLANYETSNWARGREHRSRHNLAYWRGDDWWGIGPGAHSHVAGVRWWNVKHPRGYAERLTAGVSPGYAREVLDADARHEERVMLGLRLADGVPLSEFVGSEHAAVEEYVTSGFASRVGDRIVLTLQGRLLADGIAADILSRG